MYIKLINSYSTDIQDILELANNENTYFISSWDKNENILNIDSKIIEKTIFQQEHINTYIMSKNMDVVKKRISLYLNKLGVEITKDYITVVSNGTCAAFISILQAIKHGSNNFLCIGPIYFTYMHLMHIFKKKLYHYNVDLFNEIKFDFSVLKNEIRDNHIDSIILIQPFFGSGINLKDSILEQFITFCEEQKIYLLIDYVYGNMDWNSSSHIHNTKLIQLVTNARFCILFESVSKRIFLNGMKNALIFSSPQIISNINTDSEICLGSISYIQESLLNTIYSPDKIESINHFVTNTLNYASNNYELLCTLVLGTEFQLCRSTCGYFTILGIPKKFFTSSNDKEIVNEVYQKTGIVSIPHSRYYYFSLDYYCFRINLAVETHKLIDAIEKILHIGSNSGNCDI